ncbi:MAG TPA: hypothetical protein VG820_08115 [Fimbriimonadaceae bacterium]|nr:hypothetical protein [Fimbriimonadaceae bacterium]
MERIEVSASKNSWIGLIVGGLLHSGLWLAIPYLPDKSGQPATPASYATSWILTALTFSFYAIAAWRSWLVRGLGAFADEKGVGALVDGKPTWRLDWENYGGVERVRLGFWESLRRPQNAGIRLYDRRGVAVHVLPISADHAASSKTGLATKVLIRHLNERAPEGSPNLERKPVQRMTSRRAKGFLAAGLGLAAVSFWLTLLVVGAISEGRLTSGPALLGATLGLLFVASLSVVWVVAGGIALYAQRHPNFDQPRKLPQPEEGPNVDEHRLRHWGGKRLELEEGVRYRTVHPEATAAQLRSALGSAKLCGIMGIAAIVIFVLAGLTAKNLGEFLGAAGSGLIIGGLGCLPLLLQPAVRELLNSIDDTIVKQDGQIVVVKPDGTSLGFGPNARWRKLILLSPAEEISENGVRYYIDRSNLFASEIPLDLETWPLVGEQKESTRRVST